MKFTGGNYHKIIVLKGSILSLRLELEFAKNSNSSFGKNISVSS